MRHSILVLLTLTFATALWANSAPDYVEGQVIVRFEKGVSSAQAQLTLAPLSYDLDQTLISALDIYLVKLPKSVLVTDAIAVLKSQPLVRWVQPDHILQERAVPDDPSYPSQWPYNQASDADIDAPEAWDIVTGGQDQAGEDIVVAVVDGGIRLSHADLVNNFWVNPLEVPGNGIDDDTNGYVDDVNGWNAYDSSGSLPLQNHGTHVAGLIGARGNNGLNVTGVNWNVKLMIVAASGTNTSVAAQGYNYVLKQKQDWWNTGGLRGANVVATNSSFGVDNANCASGSYPIWNDLYNAMGEEGIVSVGATANNNVDVDVVGDVPTGCSSPYIISVTNTNVLDQKTTNAAYGDTTIDLGAPGTNVLSTTSDGGTGYLSGTSMAAPHVAGAVALMHAAASLNFNNYYLAHPDSAALLLKDILLQNVDSLTSLNGLTVTGGRLNLFKAVNAISGYSEYGTMPNIRYAEYVVLDTASGNDNFQLDRGETADFVVQLLNVSHDATNVYAVLSTLDPYVTVLDGGAMYGLIERDSVRGNDFDHFVLQSALETPLEHSAVMNLFITSDGGYSVNRTFNLAVGQRVVYWSDSVESGGALWSHSNVLPGFIDEWHISTELYASATHSWKCGSPLLAANYSPLLDAGLVSPQILITPQSLLSFDSWIDSELSSFYVDSAYDGGIVEVSANGGPFIQVTPVGGYTKTIRWLRGTGTPYTGPFPGAPCYAGATAWLKRSVDLSAYDGDSVRFRFRFGSDSGTQREGWYLDNFVVRGEAPTPPEPCGGLYTLSAEAYDFVPTYVGNTVATEIVVGNFSADEVCITSITSTGGVWSVVPSELHLNAGDVGTLLVTFSPTFSHTFRGVVELFSDNPVQYRDSILLTGQACQPVQTPLLPLLTASGEENFINCTLPWDANDLFTDYAIEYSSDGFASSRFVSLDSIFSNQAEWHNAIVWGREGSGTIGQLLAGTTYAARLHARDCIGATLIGPAAFMSTATEFVVDSANYDLTAMAIVADSVILNWVPFAVDQNNDTLPAGSFEILTGLTPNAVNQSIGYSDDGTFAWPNDPVLKRFFRVRPVLDGSNDICTPLITWPPPGAWLYGYDELVLQDLVHGELWDSFRVEIDSAGFPVLLGSSFEYGIEKPVTFWVNFDQFESGPHTLSATVVDEDGQSWSTLVPINIAPHPRATFDATYDPVLNRFNATAIEYTGLTGNLVDTWWMCSLADERLGTSVSFEYKPGEDSVSLLLPFPQTDFKLWTGELEWPQATDPFIGVKVPALGSPPGTEKMPPESLGVCCIDLQLLTTGRTSSNSADRGPVLECKKEYDTYGEYEVGYRWEIETTWEVRKGQFNYSFGWDQQSTLIETGVICTTGVGVDTFRVPLKKDGKPVYTDTTHHRSNGVNYPYIGIPQGKSERDPKTARVNKPDKPVVGKQIKTYRSSHSKYIRKARWPAKDSGIWSRGGYQFYARAKDDCSDEICCREWIVDWDVVFCPECHIIEYSAPDLLDLGNDNCHDLAP